MFFFIPTIRIIIKTFSNVIKRVLTGEPVVTKNTFYIPGKQLSLKSNKMFSVLYPFFLEIY